MKHTHVKLLAAAMLLAGSQQAFADTGTPIGVDSGTTVSNTASVTYTVGTTPQVAVSNNPASTFVVDRKIDLVVAQLGGAVTVQPSQNAAVLKYTVTNQTNETMDFSLAALNTAGFPGTATVFVDAGGATGDDNYVAGTDTGTYIDELASGDSVTVFVVMNIPAASGTVLDGATSAWTLTATAAEGGTAATQGADIVTDDRLVADSPTTVEDVFADDAGATDGVEDGKHSAVNNFVVATANIAVNKSSLVIWDPINEGTRPKAIPGARVLYCVAVSNNGNTGATDVTISDVIPAGTLYQPNSIRTGANTTCTEADWTAGTVVTDGAGYDDDTPDNPAISGPAVITNNGTVAPAAVTTTMFQVVVQ